MVTDKMVEAASKVFWLAKLERRGDPTIGDLRAALKAALAAAWVPFSERLPEDCVEVLVAVWPSVYIVEREDGEWWAIDRMPSAIGGVTHWMPLPLPEPPQKAGEPKPAGK